MRTIYVSSPPPGCQAVATAYSPNPAQVEQRVGDSGLIAELAPKRQALLEELSRAPVVALARSGARKGAESSSKQIAVAELLRQVHRLLTELGRAVVLAAGARYSP